MDKETPAGAFTAVMVLAFICSLLVAGAAVGLRPRQEANRKLDKKKNILRAAGLYQGKGNVEALCQQVETKIVRLADGRFVPQETLDPAKFDQLQSAMNDETGRKLYREEDKAGLSRQEKFSLVYLVNKEGKEEQLDKVILPIRGKGLWSTLYGYVALSADLSTINGITFYEHGETPGLGGEIDNPDWQAGWVGKQLYSQDDHNGQPAIHIVKGQGKGPYQVDGVSGATLTMNGVNNLMHFWFGEHGFSPFLKRFQQEGAK
jgi:Na+-transporting NADH:ubiquinone oxidoreductase subunit C